jgi:hypothetical protein
VFQNNYYYWLHRITLFQNAKVLVLSRMMMMMEDEGHSQMGGVGGATIKVCPQAYSPTVFMLPSQ